MNDKLSVKIRKNRDNLIIIGMGTIMFGLWSLLKTALGILMGNDQVIYAVDQVMESADASEGEYLMTMVDRHTLTVSLTVILIVGTIIIVLIRAYIGMSAIKEARGGKRKNLYLVITGLFILGYGLFIFLDGYSYFQTDERDYLDTIVAVVIEAMSFITLLELLISVINIRKLADITKDKNDGEVLVTTKELFADVDIPDEYADLTSKEGYGTKTDQMVSEGH